MKSKYTFFYNAKIEALLDFILSSLAQKISSSEVAKYLDFVVLAGGYGRGEGGIFEEENTPKLYNDLDFFVIAKNSTQKSQLLEIDSYFKALAKEIEPLAEIDVDFSNALKISYVKKHLQIMSWNEMAKGAKVIFGDENRFKKIFTEVAQKTEIENAELVKLAMNRFSGLLFALEKLRNSQSLNSAEKDFIARNINKAILASADIYLASQKNLPLLASQRLIEVEKIPQIFSHYKEALEFKSRPKIDFSKAIFEKNLLNSYTILVKSYKDNAKYLSFRGIKRFLKDILLNLKTNKFFAKFGLKKSFFKNPRKRLIELAISLLDHSNKRDIDISTYKKIWEKLA